MKSELIERFMAPQSGLFFFKKNNKAHPLDFDQASTGKLCVNLEDLVVDFLFVLFSLK